MGKLDVEFRREFGVELRGEYALISGPFVMDSAYTKYNYANLNDLQNIRNNDLSLI
jgi:hypothetical protein